MHLAHHHASFWRRVWGLVRPEDNREMFWLRFSYVCATIFVSSCLFQTIISLQYFLPRLGNTTRLPERIPRDTYKFEHKLHIPKWYTLDYTWSFCCLVDTYVTYAPVILHPKRCEINRGSFLCRLQWQIFQNLLFLRVSPVYSYSGLPAQII